MCPPTLLGLSRTTVVKMTQKNGELLTLLMAGVKIYVNPNSVGGGHIVPALFLDGYFSQKKWIWRSKIS